MLSSRKHKTTYRHLEQSDDTLVQSSSSWQPSSVGCFQWPGFSSF